HLRDHALYVAFAPAEAPQIAVALIVENAGFGAQSAAPIARRVFDYWLQGLYPVDEDVAAVQQGQATFPLKPPRPASEIVMGARQRAAAGARAAWAVLGGSAASAAAGGRRGAPSSSGRPSRIG